jgi:CRP/FNR family cyclic AMP-dependent transcriptional regulator
MLAAMPRGGATNPIDDLTRNATVSVVLADRRLRQVLDRDDVAQASRVSHARLVTVGTGRWEAWTGGDKTGALGALVIEGALCRKVSVGRYNSTELVGHGDVVRPWDDSGSGAVLRSDVDWVVVERAKLALLDASFVRAIAAWPELIGELVTRGMRRSDAYASLVAATRVKRVDLRLLALFCQLAERWGRPSTGGVVVPIQLTHAQLASIVGAHRPSVTSALTRLADREILRRDRAHGYILAVDRAERELGW